MVINELCEVVLRGKLADLGQVLRSETLADGRGPDIVLLDKAHVLTKRRNRPSA